MAEAVHKAAKMATLPDLDPNAKKGGIPPVDAGFPGPPEEPAKNADRRSVWGLRGGGSGAGGGKPSPPAKIETSFATTISDTIGRKWAEVNLFDCAEDDQRSDPTRMGGGRCIP